MKYTLLLCLVLVGCNFVSPPPTTHLLVAPVTKDTGWVTIVKSDYTYHKSLQFPDGSVREFYHCDAVGALEEDGADVRIHYTGDGSTMGDCAKDVTVQFRDGTVNHIGKRIWTGTRTIKGDFDDRETIWIKPDGSKCGTVLFLDNNWRAYAFEDMSNVHYFSNRAEAAKFITDNWCKP